MLKKSLIALSVVSLVACGGGGGGGTTSSTTTNNANAPAVGITAANQDAVAQQSVSTLFGGGSAAGSAAAFGVSADSSSEVDWKLVALGVAKSAPDLFAQRDMNTAVGVSSTRSASCSGGGTGSVAVVDADNNNVLSSGDSLTLTLNNCNNGTSVGNGSATITFNTVQGSAVGAVNSKFVMTISFANFSNQKASKTSVVNGSITYTMDMTSTFPTASVVSQSLTTSVTYASATATASLQGYSDAIEDHSTFWNESVNGTVASSGFGDASPRSATFATISPFSTTKGALYPYSGQATITGANGSKLRLTVLDATQVRLELDANGDGTYEASKTVLWSSLR